MVGRYRVPALGLCGVDGVPRKRADQPLWRPVVKEDGHRWELVQREAFRLNQSSSWFQLTKMLTTRRRLPVLQVPQFKGLRGAAVIATLGHFRQDRVRSRCAPRDPEGVFQLVHRA